MTLLSYLFPNQAPTDQTSYAFKTLLALEFLAGSLFILQTALFTRSLSSRFALQTQSEQIKQAQERLRGELFKKYLKRAPPLNA